MRCTSAVTALSQLRHRFRSKPAPKPPLVSPTRYPDPCGLLEPLPTKLFPVPGPSTCTLASRSRRDPPRADTRRFPVRLRLFSRQRRETGKPPQAETSSYSLDCSLPPFNPTRFQDPLFSGLRGFRRNHHPQTTPDLARPLISTEPLCLRLRSSHRSRGLPTTRLSPVSAVPTEATTY